MLDGPLKQGLFYKSIRAKTAAASKNTCVCKYEKILLVKI